MLVATLFLPLLVASPAEAAEWRVEACMGTRRCAHEEVDVRGASSLVLTPDGLAGGEVRVEVRSIPRPASTDGEAPVGDDRFVITVVDREGQELGSGALNLLFGAPGQFETRFGFLASRRVRVTITPINPVPATT